MVDTIKEKAEEYTTQLFRLANAGEVNWEARRRLDIGRVRDDVIPAILDFSEKAIKRATYQKGKTQKMKAIIGVSGGLDSVVASHIVAESMHQSLESGTTNNTSLAIVNFEGLEDSPVQGVVEDLKKRYGHLNIKYIQQDIKPALETLRENTDGLVRQIEERSPIGYNGELITRAIYSVLNETSVRTNHATIDTTNGTEFILGEFSVGLGYDVVLLSDLYKSTIYTLGEILGVPKSVLEINPRNSAFSHTTKPQLYFGDLPEGVTPRHMYEVLDVVLYWLYEQKRKPEEVSEYLGHSLDFVKNVKRRIKNQEPRQKPPVFCTQTRGRRFPNKTKMTDIDVKRKTKDEMLGGNFRK